MDSTSNPLSVPRPEPRWLAVAQLAALWVIALAGALAVFVAYRGYVFEDGYITYRYARNLADGAGFVFQPGERVLGTMPLYALLLGFGGRLGADIPTLSAALYSSAVAAIAVLGGTLLRRLGSPNAALLFAGACVSGFTNCFRCFGLETTLLTALLLAAVLAVVQRRDLLAATLAALAFLTRYDAALLALLLLAAIGLRDRRVPWKPGIVAAAIALPWLAFARIYFGSWLPNTLAAKAGNEGVLAFLANSARTQLERAWLPLEHLLFGWQGSPLVSLCANVAVGAGIAVAVVRWSRSEPLLLLLPLHALALWVGYAWIGPPSGFSWYLTPAAFLLLLTGLAGWSLVWNPATLVRVRGGAALALGALVLALQPGTVARDVRALEDDIGYRGRVDAYTEIGDWIRANDLTSLQLLTLEPGYLTYRTGNPVIDAAGLVTRGVRFFDGGGPITTFDELIETRKPALVVARMPYLPPGYVVVHTAFPFMQLMLREDEHRRRFDALASKLGQARAGPAHALHHPFDIDARRGSSVEWRKQGGDVWDVAIPIPLTIAGEPVKDKYLFLGRPLSGAQTPRFQIDFDRLEFRFKAQHPRLTLAQLVVDGEVMLQQGGDDKPGANEFPLVSWSVRAWRGHCGQVRFVNVDPEGGWLAADHVRSVLDERVVMLDDFESGAGFSSFWSGVKLDAPTELADIALERGARFLVSRRAATTHGMAGLHGLSSKPFVIDHDRLGFMLFDFGSEDTRVQLCIGSRIVRKVFGSRTQAMKSITWDVRDLKGSLAVLRLIDRAPDAADWIGIDDVQLSD